MKTVVITVAMVLFLSPMAYAQDAGIFAGEESINMDPTAPAPSETDPVTFEPVDTTPVVSEPVVTDPVASEPDAGTPVVTDPVTEPGDSTPVVTNPDDGTVVDKHGRIKKARKPNFGMIVSAEAHRLKAEGINGQHKMGGWVSDQRRQNSGTKVAASQGGASNERGSAQKDSANRGSASSERASKSQAGNRK